MVIELSSVAPDSENRYVTRHADSWLCSRVFFVNGNAGAIADGISLQTDGVVRIGDSIREFLGAKSLEVSADLGRSVTVDQLAIALFLTPSNDEPLDDSKLAASLPNLELVLKRLDREPNKPLQFEEIYHPIQFGMRIDEKNESAI